ncbi:MAG: T9SS type A sorting domain-containing protein, partial [candidate division Zixibacteria bacterium]|nr:T9SS type A sorting domain-containing protein [candidate division Zixibacteria bacterium]
QTFSFSPDFTQGPDTISITFRARDEHDASTLKTVTIIINAVPQDLLIVTKDRGGVPGSTGKLVPLILTNLQDVYGIQFTLHFDSTALEVDSFVPTERINGFNIKSNLGDSSNQVTVLVLNLNNQVIPPGSDTILYFALSVDSLANPGVKPLALTKAREAIGITTPSKELEVVNGFFTVDKFGDVNLDTLVDIGDVVYLIAYILEDVTINPRQAEAADINRDGVVNVGDLVGVINTILGRPINAPIPPFREPLAYLHLEYDSLQAGSEGKIDLWADLKTPVAGVQLKIKYDPEQLSFSAPALTSRSNGLDIHYKDDGKGNLTVLFYRFFGKPIDSGEGSILSLPVVTSSNFDKEKLQLYLKEAILADPEAVVIPVDKGEVILPKSFSLSQNYPNPFNPNTTIRFEIGVGGGNQAAVNATLKVYNILGQVVKTLVNEPKLPGIYYQTWDGKNEQGEKVSSGLYFYQLRAGNYSETKKMVLVK